MLYVLFLILAIAYNYKKFRKERAAFLSSIIDAKNSSHREMLLSHHFYVFIFEGFLAIIVAHLLTEKAMVIGIISLAFIYLFLLFIGFYLYQFFVRHIEKHTNLVLYESFKNHLIKELRVNFAMIMLPILMYALINWAFQDNVYKEWGSLWFVGILINILFVSVLTIVCTVVIMLRLIPNREITEPEYLEIINKRLAQIEQPNIRIRWIETDIKNAFVAGVKLLKFSNQTMFIGKSLRTTLTLEEFDAVIAHELSHVANRHIHKRVIDVFTNLLSVIFGIAFIMMTVLGLSLLFYGEDANLHSQMTTILCTVLSFGWIFSNYFVLFDTLRSHEYEADAYAVLELGASFQGLKSALEKLTTPDELPEYLKALRKDPSQEGVVKKWFKKNFSTHPDLASRMSSLENKISNGLPFNYYISTPKKLRLWVLQFVDWKISIPMSSAFGAFALWSVFSYNTGVETSHAISRASAEDLLRDRHLVTIINKRPFLGPYSYMYYVVQKGDEKLIDYFLKRGADKTKTLMYLTQLKDFELFKKYFEQYQDELTHDQYLHLLRKTAQTNFTHGYRLLVNAKQFEDVSPKLKEDMSKMFDAKRAPASIKK